MMVVYFGLSVGGGRRKGEEEEIYWVYEALPEKDPVITLKANESGVAW